MKKVAIITMDRFPRGNAGATRQEILGKLFIKCGCSVDVIGFGEYTNFTNQVLFEHFNFCSLRGKRKDILSRVLDRMLFTHRTKKRLSHTETYDVVLFESVPLSLISYLKRKSKQKGYILIHDSVEWYSASEYRMGMFSREYIEKDILNRKLIDSSVRVIAISKYLENYFSSKGCKVVRIPFIHDVFSFHTEKAVNKSKIVFLYAGLMGRKDHLHNFLIAVNNLSKEEKDRIEIRLFGFKERYLIETGNVAENLLNSLRKYLKIFGRVTRSEVENNLKEASFSLLFRDNTERYAKAGFPTKVVESMSLSTPVFCNLSSDLGDYLVDGSNSIICASESVEDILIGLRRILDMDEAEYNAMSHNARLCAEKFFDYSHYMQAIVEIIEDRV